MTVSKSGKTVKVSVPFAPLYCSGGGGPITQLTKAAAISASGSFSGSIGYLFRGTTAFKVSFTGKFITSTFVKGTVRSEYKVKECSGSTSFTAKPAAAL